MIKEEKALSSDGIKLLIEKVHAAQQAGSRIVLIHNNSGTTVYITRKINGSKNSDRVFSMRQGSETAKATYSECIAYLEKLAGEEHDN